MHICTITPEYPPKIGGVGYYASNVSNKLVEKGHRVTVITRAPSSKALSALIAKFSDNPVDTHGSWERPGDEHVKGVRVYRMQFLPIYPFHVYLDGIFANRFFKSVESNFDVVHIHHPLAPLIHTSLPTVVTVHGTMKRGLMGFNPSLQSLAHKMFSEFIFPLELKTLRNADVITSDSYTTAKKLEAFYGFSVNTIRVVGNGVDDKFFVPGKPSRNPSYVLYVGRLVYSKGLIDLVKSAEYVCREDPSAIFIIVGDGPLKTHLIKLINKTPSSKRILLVGPVDRKSLLKYYQEATVYVLPSYYESFPNTTLEGMACGLPVVATRVGDLPKIVKNGKTGFLVPPRNPKILGDAILTLLKDDALRERMGKASRKEVERNYGWDFLTDKVLDCYKLAMNRK